MVGRKQGTTAARTATGIGELRKTKQNSRLRPELDVAQTEPHSLRSVAKGGRDFGRENEQLRARLRSVKEARLLDMEGNLSELRTQLAKSHDISLAAASTKTKELFFSFMGAAMDKLGSRFAGKGTVSPKEIAGIVLDVFQQCSDDVFKQIEERGIV